MLQFCSLGIANLYFFTVTVPVYVFLFQQWDTSTTSLYIPMLQVSLFAMVIDPHTLV